VINGSKGRLEASEPHSFIPVEAPDFKTRSQSQKAIDAWGAARGDMEPEAEGIISVYPLYGGVKVYRVPKATGGHGGGDVRLRDMLFRPGMPDPLGHAAGSRAGAMSVLLGAAANESIATGKPVSIVALLGADLSTALGITA
jgi:hypothetical protein